MKRKIIHVAACESVSGRLAVVALTDDGAVYVKVIVPATTDKWLDIGADQLPATEGTLK